MRRVLQLLMCLVGCLGAQSLAASESLTICMEDQNIRPWITQEGRGLNVELLDRVALRLGISFSFRRLPWKRCLDDLKLNVVQGAIGASFKPDRLEFGVFPGGEHPDPRKRLNVDRYVLLRQKGRTVEWDGANLHGLQGAVGVQLGYSITDQLRTSGVAVDDGSPGAAELMRKLFAGHVGAAALLEGEARSLMIENPRFRARLEILPVPLAEKSYYLILSHHLVVTRPALASAIWNAVEWVRESPDYQFLERQAR